ncbi:MAG: ATP-grasp domain-containing protein [Spirochaetaceae bacterium]
MYRKDRVLVTYGWCRNAWAIMRSLSRKNIQVYAGDSEKQCMCSFSKYKSGFFVYPDFRTKPEEFIDSVINYIKEKQIGVYIPVHEEILTVAKYIDRFPEDVIIPISSYEKIFSLFNNYTLWEIAHRLSVSLPRTIKPDTEAELTGGIETMMFPLIVKMQNSNGSKGVKIVETKKEALEVWKEFKAKAVLKPIVQEYVEGTMYAVSLLFNKGKEIARFVRRNLREKEYFGGTCTKAESIYKHDIADEASKILKELNYTGVVMCEFLVNESDNTHWLIEANPRYWGTTGLDIDAGVDFPYYQYQLSV